jgi:hypothetical protein
MILLSKVGSGMNLSGKYLYFANLVPSETVPCLFRLSGPNPDAEDAPALKVTYTDLPSTWTLSVTDYYDEEDPSQTIWTNICSNSGWFYPYNFQRSYKLPPSINSLVFQDTPEGRTAWFEWLPNCYYVQVCNSAVDITHFELMNTPTLAETPLKYESTLAAVNRGDDLTGKIIVFNPGVSFEEVTSSITIGNPLTDNELEQPTWLIRYTLSSTPPDLKSEINAQVRDQQLLIKGDMGWVQNWINLTAYKEEERFIVTQWPDVLHINTPLHSAYVCSRIPQPPLTYTLQIIKQAAARMHLPEPSSINPVPTDLNTSDAQNAKLLLSSLNQVMRNLAVQFAWPQLIRIGSFNAVEDPGEGYNVLLKGYDLEFICPSYDGMISPFIYAQNQRTSIAQMAERDFYRATEGYTTDSDTDVYGYRIYANHLCFSRPIDGPVKFIYKTKLIVRDQDGSWKESTEKDDDRCVFDPEALILGTIVGFKSSIGMDPAVEANLFERYITHLRDIIGSPTYVAPDYVIGT